MENKKEVQANTKKSAKVFVPVIAVLVAVVSVLSAYGTYLVSRYGSGSTDTIAKGVTVEGIDVSGSKEDAIVKIEAEMEALDKNVIELIMDDNRTKANFAEFEVEYAIEEAVTKAGEYGKTGNIFSRVADCFNISRGKADIKVETKVDPEQVSDYVLTYSQAIGCTVIENSYAIVDDKLELTPGKSGTGIDRGVIEKEITALLESRKSGQIGVELVPIDPQPWDVDKVYADICKGPSDAGYEVIDGKGYIMEAKKGYKFKKEDLEKLLDTDPEKGVYTLELEVTEPGSSKIDETGLFPEVISQYKSSLAGSSYNRRTNVAVACKSVDGTILNPDEIFSYNKVIGAVTTATGYLPATIFTSKGHEDGIGGGICQLSSTLYCAALEGNLEIVKRRNHMYIVGYVPYGQDATVYEGELDFRFKNNTNEPMKISAKVINGEVVVKFLGKKPDPDIRVVMENITVGSSAPGTTIREDETLDAGTVQVIEKGTIGLTVDTYKNIYKKDELISREYLHRSVYKPINRIEVHGTKPVETPASTEPAEGTVPPETQVPETVQPAPENTPENVSGNSGEQQEENTYDGI